MRRFTDPLFSVILFILSALIWWIMSITGNMPVVPSGQLAPMTFGVVVVIATPAFLLLAGVGVVRALLNVRPRVFWAWVAATMGCSTVVLYLANTISRQYTLQIGFNTAAWYSAIIALCALLYFVMALTGAIPTKETEKPGGPVAEDVTRKRGRKIRKTQPKEEERGVVATPVATEAFTLDLASVTEETPTPTQGVPLENLPSSDPSRSTRI